MNKCVLCGSSKHRTVYDGLIRNGMWGKETQNFVEVVACTICGLTRLKKFEDHIEFLEDYLNNKEKFSVNPLSGSKTTSKESKQSDLFDYKNQLITRESDNKKFVVKKDPLGIAPYLSGIFDYFGLNQQLSFYYKGYSISEYLDCVSELKEYSEDPNLVSKSKIDLFKQRIKNIEKSKLRGESENLDTMMKVIELISMPQKNYENLLLSMIISANNDITYDNLLPHEKHLKIILQNLPPGKRLFGELVKRRKHYH